MLPWHNNSDRCRLFGIVVRILVNDFFHNAGNDVIEYGSQGCVVGKVDDGVVVHGCGQGLEPFKHAHKVVFSRIGFQHPVFVGFPQVVMVFDQTVLGPLGHLLKVFHGMKIPFAVNLESIITESI